MGNGGKAAHTFCYTVFEVRDTMTEPMCAACCRIGSTYLDYIHDEETGVGARMLYHAACEALDHTCGRLKVEGVTVERRSDGKSND